MFALPIRNEVGPAVARPFPLALLVGFLECLDELRHVLDVDRDGGLARTFHILVVADVEVMVQLVSLRFDGFDVEVVWVEVDRPDCSLDAIFERFSTEEGLVVVQLFHLAIAVLASGYGVEEMGFLGGE